MSPPRRASRESALPSGEGSRHGSSESGTGGARRADVPPGHVLLGEFGRAHGLKGEVRIKSYTADPLAIAGYGPLATSGGRIVVLAHVRQAAGDQPDLLVAKVEGVRAREGAEALNRLPLYAPRERLGDAADEDEFFLADLIGMDARTSSGAEIGRVVAVPNFGGGDLLEIRPAEGGATILVPFTKAFVPEIDVAGGRVTVEMPAADSDSET